jgi:hypothetical protein
MFSGLSPNAGLPCRASRRKVAAPYQRPIKQSLKRCTLSCPTWLRSSVASGSSPPTLARHICASDEGSGLFRLTFCAALHGAAAAIRHKTSTMVLISPSNSGYAAIGKTGANLDRVTQITLRRGKRSHLHDAGNESEAGQRLDNHASALVGR